MFQTLSLNHQIHKTFKRYHYSPTRIDGAHFPENLKPFHNWMSLPGRDIDLHWSDLKAGGASVDKNLTRLYRTLSDAQREWLNCRHNDKLSMNNTLEHTMTATCEEKLKAAYRSVLEAELERGLVRIACQLKRYDPTATVKSKYTDRIIRYSPITTTIQMLDSEDCVAAQAALFAHAYVENLPCKLINVNLGQPITNEEIPQIYQMMSEVMDACNTFQIAEFHRQRNNPTYQHRNDWAPASF